MFLWMEHRLKSTKISSFAGIILVCFKKFVLESENVGPSNSIAFIRGWNFSFKKKY